MERDELLSIITKEYSNWIIDPKPSGKGSYGVVFQMTSQDSSEKRALKVISIPHDDSEIEERRNSGFSDEEIFNSYFLVKDKVLDEIINVIQLRDNENVVRIYGHREITRKGQLGWIICFDMEFLPSIKEIQPLSETEIIQMGSSLCNALKSCHERNIIHRDIKPQNILRRGKTFVLADFGESKIVTNQSSLSLRGTYDYMAPEVVRQQRFTDVSPAVLDIYSLGMTLYLYANNNCLPFIGMVKEMMMPDIRDEANIRRWNNEPLPMPSGVSERLGRIILCACQADPRNRYQSASEMEYDLLRVNTQDVLNCDRRIGVATPERTPINETIPVSVNQTPYSRETVPVNRIQNNQSYTQEQVPIQKASVQQVPVLPYENITPKAKHKNTKLIVGILVGILAVIFAVVGSVFLFSKNSTDDTVVSNTKRRTSSETSSKYRSDDSSSEEKNTSSETPSNYSSSVTASDGSINNKMTFEQNYDQAAIDQMNKVVKIHNTQFTALDYNYYFANEYVKLKKMNVEGTADIPMTQAGFLDMEGQLTPDMKVKDYLRNSIISDFQSEVFILEYAQKNNVQLGSDTRKKIEEEFGKAKKSAESIGMTLDEYLKAFYGPTATEDGLREILQRYELVNAAMDHYVEVYNFTEGESMLPTVYHVLYPTLDLTTGEKLPDDKKAEAKKKAEALKASATSLDDLKMKAEQGKAANEVAEAAEYTVSAGQMVKPFEDWCFAYHNVGDMDVIETEFGYHVMYFVGMKETSTEQKRQIALSAFNAEMEKNVASGLYNPIYS